MTLKSISRKVAWLAGACGAAVLFAIMPLGRDPPPEISATAAMPAALPLASGARRDESSAPLATTDVKTDVLAALPHAQDADDFVPTFDVARIERTGDAVIAGRAAPGAIVDLLLNDNRYDRATADRSGQFVMVPPRIPPGDYELTLRSRRPDGKRATSERRVVVSRDAEFGSDALNSRAEMIVAQTAAANPQPSDLPRGQSTVRFAAVSLTDGQGARTIISNVLEPANGTHSAPCQVRVSFFGADGSPIGGVTMVQLKAGESTSVSALHPPKLVRAIVSIGDVVDPSKVCALRTRLEIFDLQTDTTFVSVPGESIGSDSECRASVGSRSVAPRAKN